MKKLALIFGVFYSVIAFSQEDEPLVNGFYGIKRYVTLDWQVSTPWIYNSIHRGELLGPNLENARASMMMSYRFTYSTIIDDESAFSLELGTSSYDFALAHNTKTYSTDVFAQSVLAKENILATNLKSSLVNVRSYSILPIFEFATDPGLIPSGLFHQVGIGYSWAQLTDQKYKLQVTGISNDGLQTPVSKLYTPTNFYDYKSKSLKTVSFMYGVTRRVPISKHVLVSYGVRYMLNMPLAFHFHMNGESSEPKSSEYIFSNSDAKEQMNVRLFQSAIHFNLGMTFGW